jgi:hypothetical protein
MDRYAPQKKNTKAFILSSKNLSSQEKTIANFNIIE